LSGTLRIETDVARMPTVDVPVSAEITGIEFKVTPKVLLLRQDVSGGEVGMLKITGDPSLRLTDARADNELVQCAIEPTSTPGEVSVKVTLSSTAQGGKVVGRITLTLAEGSLTEQHTVAFLGSGDRSTGPSK
jgi:hypothetical protein